MCKGSSSSVVHLQKLCRQKVGYKFQNYTPKGEAARCAMRLKNLGYFKDWNFAHRAVLEVKNIAFDLIKSRWSFTTAIPSIEMTMGKKLYAIFWQSRYIHRWDKIWVRIGSGIYCQKHTILIKVRNECPVFKVEVLAVKLTVTLLLRKLISQVDQYQHFRG